MFKFRKRCCILIFLLFVPVQGMAVAENRIILSNQPTNFNALFELQKKVLLKPKKDYNLSTVPKLVAVNKHGDYIILDNFINRQILVFDKDGQQKAEIGRQGKNSGEYMFPDCLYYNKKLDKYYVYDGDLLKIIIYDGYYRFEREFQIPLFFESLVVTDDERFFCYTSGAASKKGPDKVIYECDKEGKILDKFCDMSENYNPLIETKALGIVHEDKFLYIITPYEYILQKYDLNGKLVKRARGYSKNYVPPRKLSRDEMQKLKEDFFSAKKLHNTFSHILYLLRFSEKFIGVVYTSSNRKSAFLDLYDMGLNLLKSDVNFPMGPDGDLLIYSQGKFLYRVIGRDAVEQYPSIYVYKFCNFNICLA